MTSTAPISDLQLNQGEMIGVKVNRTLGPVLQDRNSFRKMGLSPDEFSFLLGQQFGPEIAVDYVNTAVGAVRAAISNVAALQFDNTVANATPETTLNHTAMISGLQKFGDRASRIICWLTHSKPYFDLMRQQVADKLFEVAGATVYTGTLATFGKPGIVIRLDQHLHCRFASTVRYDVSWGPRGTAQLRIAESEERDIISQPVTGQANLADRIQGEYAFNVRVEKGFQYTTTNGINPTRTPCSPRRRPGPRLSRTTRSALASVSASTRPSPRVTT